MIANWVTEEPHASDFGSCSGGTRNGSSERVAGPEKPRAVP